MFILIKKYKNISKTERQILNYTFFWLMLGFVLARLIPLRWFSSMLGDFQKENQINLSIEQKETIRLVKKNIRRLKKRLPWKVKCFEEAIAAKKVLEKWGVKSTLYLGVKKGEKEKMMAHAWLISGEEKITGEKGYEKFTIVGCYA